MKNLIEHNFIAGEDLAEGQVVCYHDGALFAPTNNAAEGLLVGVVAQAVSAGEDVCFHSLTAGKAIYVLVTGAAEADAVLGIDGDGNVSADANTNLHFVAMEAKTDTGAGLCQCVVVD